eukprot:GEMP01038751.1.p1 GENE.GEMP01038751.1~~GEMP01038751.1.p1  ORF type:complete len:226 (+),score=53.09 GEMP01038751.1:117-794(+)
MLAAFARDASHQELARIISEVEEFYSMMGLADQECSDDGKWLDCEAAETFLMGHLGYGDLDELEDALGGKLSTLLKQLPQCTVKVREEDDVEMFRFARIEPKGPRELRLRVSKSEQLWIVFLKDADATAEIPEIEFEFGREAKREVDSIYNFLAKAITNLEQHADMLRNAGQPEKLEPISEAIDGIRQCLDLDEPFTLVIRDPRGLSELKPFDDVEIREYTPEDA